MQVRTDCTVARWSIDASMKRADHRHVSLACEVESSCAPRRSVNDLQHWHPSVHFVMKISNFDRQASVSFACGPSCHLASTHQPRLSCWPPIQLSWRLPWGEDECTASLDSTEFPGRPSAQDYPDSGGRRPHAFARSKKLRAQGEVFFCPVSEKLNVVNFHSKNETALPWLSRRKAILKQ